MPKEERDASLQEAKLLSALHHPNIVTCLESFTERGKLCIVQDYCAGGDLYQRVKAQRGAPLPETTIVDWFTEILLGLKHVHDRKVLHRDLKTQNVFLTADGRCKLGDFGVSKVLAGTHQLASTAVGTPYYLSPEICENKPYDHKSDVWSLGCILYELCAQRHPFDGASLKLLIVKILRGVYPPVPARYGKTLCDTIREMLSRDPARRPSVNDLLARRPFRDAAKRLLDDDVHADEFSHTVLHGEKKGASPTVSREPIKLRGRPVPKVSGAERKSAATSAGDASRAERSPTAAAKCAANDARRAGARAAPVGRGLIAPRRDYPNPAPLPARPRPTPSVGSEDARRRAAVADAAEKRRLAAEINAKNAAIHEERLRAARERERERAREREREAAERRRAAEAARDAARREFKARQAEARANRRRASDAPPLEIFVGGDVASRARARAHARVHTPPEMGVWPSRRPTPTQPRLSQPQPQPRYFGGGPVEALPADRRRAALSARDEATREAPPLPLARARTPADAAAARRLVYEENRAAAERNRARVEREERGPSLVSAGNALKVAYERHRTTSTPPPAPATPSRDGRDFDRGSRGNQARIADEEETRRRAFWEGRAAAERNRRRAMEDEFSGGAGVDVGVSEEGARLLIDPGTGVYGALGADTAPPDDEELVRAKRDAAEEKAAEETARGERLSTEDSRARADSPPSESKPVADVRAPATSHKRRTPPSSSSDESETDAMDLEESFELPSKFYLDGRTVRLPDVDAEASAGKRAAALRAHLRERLGEGKFDAAYRALDELDERDDEDKVVGRLCEVMGEDVAYLGLVHQLLVCEDGAAREEDAAR